MTPQVVGLTALWLAFCGIAWCLSKFALIGYRALRHQLAVMRIRKMLDETRSVTDWKGL